MSDDLSPATTLAAARRALAAAFAEQAGEEAGLDARLLVEAATGLSHAALIAAPDTALGEAAATLAAMAARRRAGEPISRILGRRAFWSMTFRVTPDVLDPRPDTETLIEAAVELFAERRGEMLRIVDFGVGSGAILAALLREFPNAVGVGVDLSPAAAALARENIARLGLAGRAVVRVGDWDEGMEGRFDLIASNPPYIPSRDVAGLAREVRDHDPRMALDGGADGLAAYRRLARIAALRLAPGGAALFEVGIGQAAEVADLCVAEGLRALAPRVDLNGVERVVIARAGGGKAGNMRQGEG